MLCQMKSKDQPSLRLPGLGEAAVLLLPAPSPTRTLQTCLNGGNGTARLGALRVGGGLALGKGGLLLAPSCGDSGVKLPKLLRGPQNKSKGKFRC